MKKITLLTLSLVLLCCCNKPNTPSSITLDKHSVEIYPGESVEITANIKCDWEYHDDAKERIEDKQIIVFTAKDAGFCSDRTITVYAGYLEYSGNFHRKDECVVTIKAPYQDKGKVRVYYYSGTQVSSSMKTIYSYHGLAEYYLVSFSENYYVSSVYKVYENPLFHQGLDTTAPEYTCKYRCDYQGEPYYFNF